jgi:hypothetical protein
MTLTRKDAIAVLFVVLMTPAAAMADDVLQHHANSTRDGRYVDPSLTKAAVQTVHRDTTFNAPVTGPIYAQPLFVSNGPGGRAAFIVATEWNTIAALDASNGSLIWSSNLGTPVPLSQLPCGDIDQLGVTGTPVIDVGARVIYLDAMTTPDNGITKRHRIFAVSLDDGSTIAGWPFDVEGLMSSGTIFDSSVQNQRGALLLNGGTLYVPYGGHFGDCGDYHGWVVAVPVANPASATAWVTQGFAGGSWAPGGLASDGTAIFAATGNTEGATNWGGGEAILRLGPGATFSGNTADFFTPSNWQDLDAQDRDLGGSGPILIDVPGATPSQLVVALGKNGVAYLLDRNNLGGIGTGDGTMGEGVASLRVSDGPIINAAAAYTVASGNYVVFHTYGEGFGCPGDPGDLVALRIGAASPPTLTVAWCASIGGAGSPIVTTTDESSQPVIWYVGSEGDNLLHALDGETGASLFAGGGAAEQMPLVRRYQTPIVVNGSVLVAAEDGLYAFTVKQNIAHGILDASLDSGSLAGTTFQVAFSYDADQVGNVGDSYVEILSFDFTLRGTSFSRNWIFQGGQAIFHDGVIQNVTASFQVFMPPDSPVNNITFGFGGDGVIGYIDLANQFGSGSFTFENAGSSSRCCK